MTLSASYLLQAQLGLDLDETFCFMFVAGLVGFQTPVTLFASRVCFRLFTTMSPTFMRKQKGSAKA